MSMKKLRVRKSPGEDAIHSEFLKHMGDYAKQKLLWIFNHIWKMGIVPENWKSALIIPILKRGKNPDSVSNFRPISLTSIVAKLFERMVNTRLNWYLENFELLCQEQAGFRKNRSTADQVTFFSQAIKDTLDKREILTAVYVDFKSVYDSIWRELLIQKLFVIGIDGNMLNWFRAFLGRRSCKVQFELSRSKSFSLQTGIPQGSVTSCTLFNIYINDLILLLKRIPNINCLLYADDLVIWTIAPKKNAKAIIESTLNSTLNSLLSWCQENNMSVNLSKCYKIWFGKPHPGTLKIELPYTRELGFQLFAFSY